MTRTVSATHLAHLDPNYNVLEPGRYFKDPHSDPRYIDLKKDSAAFGSHSATLIDPKSPNAPLPRTAPKLNISKTAYPSYPANPSLLEAASNIKNGTAFSALEPRSEVKNNLLRAVGKLNLLPQEVGDQIARYAQPLGKDFDGTDLFPRLTAEHSKAIGEILDQYAATRFEEKDPAQNGAQRLIGEMFPAGSTKFQSAIDGGNAFTRLFQIMGHNLRQPTEPSHALTTTTPVQAQVAGLLAHASSNDSRAFSLLTEQTPYPTVLGAHPSPKGASPFAFNLQADKLTRSDAYDQWEDQGNVDYKKLNGEPGPTLMQVRYDLLDPKYSFTNLFLNGGQLTSDLTNELVGALQISRGLNRTGSANPLESYSNAHAGR